MKIMNYILILLYFVSGCTNNNKPTQKQMPANAELVVGLDIGTTKIAAIVGYKNENGKVEILSILFFFNEETFGERELTVESV